MSDTPKKSKTSPGGRAVFNDAMSPRPSAKSGTASSKPATTPDMNSILRQKITSPTHMRRFDSADYFMEREFPKGHGALAHSSHETTADSNHNATPTTSSGGDYFGTSNNADGGDGFQNGATFDDRAYTARRPPALEHRWATRTTRPADDALNSPHPAGPRALKTSSLSDLFTKQDSGKTSKGTTGTSARPSDMNLILRAKLAGKSRLRRFDSADYFRNQATGELEPFGGQPLMGEDDRFADDNGAGGIQSLAIATNVGTRSRGRNLRVDATLGDDDDSEHTSVSEDSNSAAGAGAGAREKGTPTQIPSPFKLQRSKPRSLQPGRQERYNVRERLGQRAELARHVPPSPSDHVGFFRKKFSPSIIRAQMAGQERQEASHTTPQKSPYGQSPGGSLSRRRSNSRAMPASDNLRTPADIRKAALHSRLSSQGKALYE